MAARFADPDRADRSTTLSVTGEAIEQVLGGEWRDRGGRRCFVVERRVEPTATYGCVVVGDMANDVHSASDRAPMVAGGAAARPPFLFFDLETTGLSGGAGTCAFLIGCAQFEADAAFVSRQYVLVGHADEPPLLRAIAGELARAGALVTFNGKSFDMPILETRYLFHRLEWTGGGLPHVDMLHAARRFWREDETSSCSLARMETLVLGVNRTGDVPGHEIPGRYFQFVRSGDPRPLAAVLEHNRLDLLSLAGLTARLLRLVASGPDHARDAREALALGQVYARAGLDERARTAYAHAACGAIPGSRGSTRGDGSLAAAQVDALRALAIASRRARRYDEAAACWGRLVDAVGCPRHVAREAAEALAIHHEHRRHDPETAKVFALRSLDGRPEWADGVGHRLARLERKIGGAAPGAATLLRESQGDRFRVESREG
jgi:uncharacterized protein